MSPRATRYHRSFASRAFFPRRPDDIIRRIIRAGLFLRKLPAIGTVSDVASRLCDEAKPGQILISPRVLTKVENAVRVEPVGEFELKGIRRPLAAYNVVAVMPPKI